MEWLTSGYLDHLVTAVLVFARLSAMLIAMPAFSLPLSRQLKLLLPVALTILILPSIEQTPSDLQVDSFFGFVIAALFEGVVGFFIGTVVQLLIIGVQVGGELISHSTGLQLGGGAPLSSASPTNLISTLVGVLVTTLVFASGGHRLLVKILLDSYQSIPVGSFVLKQKMLDLVTQHLSDGVIAGIKFAAPVVGIILLSNLLTGLISRTLPQINVFAVGLSLNAIALLAGLSVTVGSVGWLFQAELILVAERMSQAW